MTIFSNGLFEGRLWLAMELCSKGSLSRYLEKRWNARDAAQLVMQVARATQVVHQFGIIHRDIKPGNILLDRNGSPRLADFDLAQRTNLEDVLSQNSNIMGTPAYIAPEQVRDRKVDHRADIHGLGGVLYHLLTARPPFVASSAYGVLLQAVHTDPFPPKRLHPEISADLDMICRKCLAKNPADRYQTAKDLADDLDRFLKNLPVKARPLSLPMRLWRWTGRLWS